ncbi:MAG: epimerase [Candidatus Andersenbacteria bacterium RIFCSPHIGHO2_02_FULL_45_11]|nr:MAG: epimerase [Candidatus Andersenbacteria bacterium RIFCSPHIGHO2_02_FULL_45_11]
MSKVLITGGAGFLGINLTRYLLALGHQVISYDFADFDYPEKEKITVITKDIRNKKDLDDAMNDVDIVVHCAAALPLYSPKDIYTTDVDGTRNVLTSAFEHGVQRVIHISSTAVYGIPDHHPLFENDKLIGVGPYGEAKILAEQECEKFRAQGKCVPIIRPKSFVGPERLGVFALFYDWALTGHNFPMIGMGHNKYQLLDVEDLCDAIYLCVTKEELIANDTFNIGAKEYTTMKEDYQAVLDKAGHGKKIIGFPASPMIWTLRLLEALKISPLYKWVYETASVDSFVSIEKAEQQLGYAPKFSNKQALVRNYNWYVEHLDSFKNASGVSHRVPWKQGILGIVKHLF